MEPIVILIPTNYTDAGKILGVFPIRNILEAAVLGIPLSLSILLLAPFSLTANIIILAILVVPVCGFALFGIHDYSLFTFLRLFFSWRKSRRIVTYRGFVWENAKKRK